MSVSQLCPTLCKPIDHSPPGSSVHGTVQARLPEWVAISFSWGSTRPRDSLGLLNCRQMFYHLTHQEAGDPTKGLRFPRECGFEGQLDLITELPEDWGNRLFKGTNKTLSHQDPGERSSDPTTASQTCL